MSTTTAINSLQIPQLADAPDIELAIHPFANGVDTRVIPRFASPAARDTAIPAPTEGMMAWASSTAELYIYTTTWISAKARQVFKTANQNVTNTTVMQDATQMLFPAEINSFYVIQGFLFMSATTFARDFKSDWTVPGGATGFHGGHTIDTTGTHVGDMRAGAATDLTNPVSGSAGDTADTINTVFLYLATGGNSGNIQLRFAQLSASAGTSTTMKAGSWLECWKIG